MEKQIRELDGQNAIHILNTIAESRLRSGSFETELTPEIK